MAAGVDVVAEGAAPPKRFFDGAFEAGALNKLEVDAAEVPEVVAGACAGGAAATNIYILVSKSFSFDIATY